MRAEWLAECGADDPVLVVPWHSADEPDKQGIAAQARFIDLRENPYDLDCIPEAEAHPPLLQALRALNAQRSPVFTAKCDAWAMDVDELAATRDDLDLIGAEAPHGFMSYVDLLWRERISFVSFPRCEQRVTRFVRLLEALEQPFAAVECVLRPALVDLPGPACSRAQEGFAVSLYVKALGTDKAHAYQRWSEALGSAVTLLRGREFAAL